VHFDLANVEWASLHFAVGSGGRVWEVLSRDSDYGVRVVYARIPWDYISVYCWRDVIKRPTHG